MAATTESIFVRDGERFLPTELARGPWTPQAQHGGAPAALLARLVEDVDGGAAMLVTRLTIELLRPVPIAPLAARTRILRPGRRVQLVEASLWHEDTEVARCTALRLRRAEMPMPAYLPTMAPPPAPHGGSESLPPWAEAASYRGFHNAGVEHRFVRGSFDEPGPAVDWIRLRVPLLRGEATSPLSRVGAAADFGNGISWVLHRADGYSFINPDLTIYLHRHPVGEWVCLDAVTYPQSNGVGLAESWLFDEQGPIGRAAQSLLIERSPS
ncbi:MAG TPA: thioesterase family protein [Candidatus Dormibacteraeota bacterium]|nr:thioesterase family protein [Candidatus Dormibacteraeota bacterium]